MTEALNADYATPRPFTPRAKAQPQGQPLPLVAEETEVAPYPIAALGGRLAVAAVAIEETAQCPGAIAAQSVLTCAALAVQGHYDAEHPATGATPCSLFAITLAESGERKSTADKLASRAIERLQAEGKDAYGPAYASWLNECDARKAARARITSASKKAGQSWREMKDALDEIGPDPFPPIHPVHMLGDTNVEGAFKRMLHAPGSLTWNNAEAGQVIGGTAFSQDNVLKTVATLSRLWDGAALDRIRAGDGAEYLKGRRLSLHWQLQPDVAAPIMSDPVICPQGFFSRVLICRPATRIGKRLFREASADLAARLAPYEARLEELLRRTPRTGERPNELLPVMLPWSPEAKAIWREFYDQVEGAMGDGCDLEEHRGFGSKIAENVARIATVQQVFNDEAANCVTLETMRNAVTLGAFYLDEAQRLHALARQSAELTLAEKVRAFLTDATRWPDAHVTQTALMQFGPSKVRSKEKAAAAIRTLMDYGWLGEAEPAEVRGKRSAKAHAIWGRT